MIKNTIKHLFATAVILLTASSCLEKYPPSAILEEDAMQTYSDAGQHLVGIYSGLLSSSLYSGLLTVLPDIQADLVYAVEGFSNTYGNIWLWDIHSTDSEIQSVYGSLYSVIGNCNFFLDRIDAVIEAQTDDDRIEELEDYTGQVLTIRAMCYSELAKFFCKAYDPATAENELGVMLRTKYFEDEPQVRSSLYDTYAFICSDLDRAEELLLSDDEYNTGNSTFITAATAWALHARVALYMQDWETAIEYSTKIIDKTNLFRLTSVNSVSSDGASEFAYMWAYDYGAEVIWTIGFTTTAYGGALGSVFLGFNRDFTYFYPDYVPAAWVLNCYDSGDDRLGTYFADSGSGITIGSPAGMDWPLLVKYYGNYSLMSTSMTSFIHMNMPKPFRLAEQYLIRAEAYCRKAQYSKASEDITTLHASRYTSGGAVSLSADNWLDEISEERVKELYMEGFRLQDLKRWGKGFTRKPQSYSVEEGSSLSISADNPLFVWPIPQHELDVPGSMIEPNESNK